MSGVAPGIVEQRLDLPIEHSYSDVLWFPDGLLVVGLIVDNNSRMLRYFSVEDRRILEIHMPTPEFCRRINYPASAVLPDGRLGVVQRCYDRWPDRPAPLGNESYLLAYDWTTNSAEALVDEPLPNSELSTAFTWNPDLTLGIQAFSGLDGTLYWISPSGAEPMTITVSDNGRAWSLHENFAPLRDHQTAMPVGVAKSPAWAPDGLVIAFVATLDSIRRNDMDRTGGPWNLYLMDPVARMPRAVLQDLYYPTGLHWSPDGKWLAFLARAGGRRQNGLWMFSPDKNQLHMIADGQFMALAWSPAGDRIAANKCIDAVCLEREIWQYDIGVVTGDP